jgi:DNA-directed RNA polymerase specialized sigma24 family protein
MRASAGNAALTALYREHLNGLIRMAVLLVGDEATAEDVVQDVFVRLQRSMGRLDCGSRRSASASRSASAE